MRNWAGRRVLVTGGASFIGSHLVAALVKAGAEVRVVDDFSSGRFENLDGLRDVEIYQDDLRGETAAADAVRDKDIVFHLAAAHGGRGYVDTHQGVCATNMLLDSQVFNACLVQKVEKVVFASSACIYPLARLKNHHEKLKIREDMAGPPFDPDGTYGWAKYAAEVQLRAFSQDFGLRSAVCRFFHVYGERMLENHALLAFVARAYIRQDPFQIWGTGQQVRDWIYVDDIVSGLLLAAEKIEDGTAVNLGTGERHTVMEAAKFIARRLGYTPRFETQPDMPTGPYNRVADISLAKELLGWEPTVKFEDGLGRVIEWYVTTHDFEQAGEALEKRLAER